MADDDLPDTSAAAVGARLSLVREARGFQQAAFAGLLDLTPQAYNAYERGRNMPQATTMAKVRRLTGATSDYLLFGDMTGLPNELVSAIRKLERRR